jgi:hypothetical protein
MQNELQITEPPQSATWLAGWAGPGIRRLLVWPAILLGIVLVVARIQYGSVSGAVQRIQGHVLGVDRRLIDLGEVDAESVSSVEYNVRNLSNAPLQIIGARVDCGCVDASQLPISLSPGASSTLEFKFHARKSDVPTHVQHEIELYLDRPSPPVALGFSATVLPPSSRDEPPSAAQ